MTTVQAGRALTVNVGSWLHMAGANPIFTYQWTSDGVNITGATASSYITKTADVGHAISCEVTAHNDGGFSTVSAAAAVSVTTTTPIVVTGAPRTYAVEVAWGQVKSGLFTFDVSQFGSTTDLLGSAAWSGVFAGPLSDLTDRTRRISIVRGRDNFLSAMQSGTLTLSGIDPDGALNIRNPASPIAGSIYTGVPIRVSAYTSGGVKAPLYYGFVNTLTSDPATADHRYGTFQITASDLFGQLQRQKPSLGSLSGLTTGTLFRLFLSSIDWTDERLIDLASGDALPNGYTRADGTNDLLSLVEEALTSERGFFFIGGDGSVTYRDRYSILTSPSLATISKIMRQAPSALDDSRIITRWTVTRVAMDGSTVLGTPQVASVATGDRSLLRYGYTDDSISSPTLVSDNQALSLAQFMLANTISPAGVGWQVPLIPPDDATFDDLVQRDLGDRVTLTVAPDLWASYTQDYIIQQITHEIVTDPTQPQHTTTWGLSEVPSGTPFRFGISQMGGGDYLAY